jgi:hypothetical protein
MVWARVQRGGARPLAGHRLAHDAPACSGSAAAQGLRVVRLVPVWSVARCPLAWPQRPAAGAFDRTGAARGGLTRWGRLLSRWWGRSPAHAPPGWVCTRGNCSDRLRQPVGPARAWCGRVCGVVGVARAGPVGGYCLACRAQAAPLHRPCWWRGWCWCGRCRLTKWGRWLESTRIHSLELSKHYGTNIATRKHRA